MILAYRRNHTKEPAMSSQFASSNMYGPSISLEAAKKAAAERK